MHIVHHHLPVHAGEAAVTVPVRALRETLSKRRWRAVAEDGREFGFDLDHLLSHGDFVFIEGAKRYAIEQQPEPVLEVKLGSDISVAAQRAWQMGNLHFPVQITPEVIRVADDSAVRQMLEREHIDYAVTMAVFCPITGAGHGHHHHD